MSEESDKRYKGLGCNQKRVLRHLSYRRINYWRTLGDQKLVRILKSLMKRGLVKKTENGWYMLNKEKDDERKDT